ncbi:MAG: 16S rRNA (adenine(1518)-N(6)/adenine(1519)-N(6))-dimethyltransferase RsmA [Myxococcota bacterium]|nr:16S rRNA (adenine(1518)-N(6)/adenine(1519)-N(6))-dimethyltransferase RsmA [Myxococcota bacterium]
MKAKKALGQHFLRDPEVLQDIVATADVGRSAGVLEIGPGEGALTAFLAQSGRPVVALEKDADALVLLRDRLGERVKLVQGDALKEDLSALLPAADADGRRPVVVGNLPYNAASPIFRRLLDLGDQVSRMVLMFQYEVGQRIAAEAGSRSYGLLSVVTALCADAWVISEIPPEAFAPRPKVKSALVLVEPRDKGMLPPDQVKPFISWVATLFQSRRKTLGKTLDDPDVLVGSGLEASARPESLSPEQLIALYRALGCP